MSFYTHTHLRFFLLVTQLQYGACRGAITSAGSQECESIQVSAVRDDAPSQADGTNPDIRAAWQHTAKLVQKQLPSSIRPNQAELQPILARTAPKHPLHRVAFLKQSKGRWYTTHSTISATVKRFTTSASRSSGVRFDRSSFPKSRIGDAVTRQSGRAPFASTLRPNLTGGTLGRTAGGYTWGSGRAGGARYFSHGPAAPAQVISNVSQAVRAFLLGGQKAQFDGVDPQTGEKRFKSVSTLQDKVYRNLNKAPKATPGSYISFDINPTVTALTPLGATKGFASAFAHEKDSLNKDGFLDILSIDFSRAVKELAGTLKDLQRLSSLGDLPITYEHSTLKVHFPGCDSGTVEKICDEFGVQRGVITQDEDFDSFAGTEIALLFPFAASRTPSEYSFYEKSVTGRQYPIDWKLMMTPSVLSSDADHYSTYSEDGMEYDDIVEGNPWSSPTEEGYESLHMSEVDEFDYHSPLEYQGIQGIYKFMEQCEAGG